ncbi:MAG: deaminase [Anaerovoracaceae bacterium]
MKLTEFQGKTIARNLLNVIEELLIYDTDRAHCEKRIVTAIVAEKVYINDDGNYILLPIAKGTNGMDNKHECKRKHCNSGEHLDLCTGIHAEERAIRIASNKISSFKNTILFVTNKPCKDCMFKIARAGIKEVMYIDDYNSKLTESIAEKLDINTCSLRWLTNTDTEGVDMNTMLSILDAASSCNYGSKVWNDHFEKYDRIQRYTNPFINKKRNIFCIVGRSCSGKDTIRERLLDMEHLGASRYVMYTNRPKRIGEFDGIHYNFINKDIISCDQMRDELAKDKISVIHTEEYSVVDPDNDKWYLSWYYAIPKLKQSPGDNHIIICNPESAIKIKNAESNNPLQTNVYIIKIDSDEDIILNRMITREEKQENPNFDEVFRRYSSDKIRYGNHKEIKYDLVVKNNHKDIDNIVEELEKFIISKK